MGWLVDWGLWLLWYVLLAVGWWGWFRARAKAERLERELTRMAHGMRYTTRPRT